MALLRPLIRSNLRVLAPTCSPRKLSSTVDTGNPPESKIGGYAQAFEKFESLKDQGAKESPQNFVSLLRNSKLIDLGDPEGKIVTGKIFHVVDDDLYIDFGWKFHCVCPRPKKNASDYVRGSKVRIRIKELELSSKFLGYEKDITLLEAECFLLSLVQDRSKNVE